MNLNLTLQQRFANLRLFLSRTTVGWNESEAATDAKTFIDELEKAVSVGPPPAKPVEQSAES